MKAPAALGRRAWRLFSSVGLSCTLLCLLGLLTFLGTLAQVEHGLHAVQKTYFESFFLIQRLGPVPIPLPGANLVLTLLFFNLAVGGITRLARRPGTGGVLVTHAGMLILLLSGFVKLYHSEDGHVTLYEGQRADAFRSYTRWELAIGEEQGDGTLLERIVAQERFLGAAHGSPVRIADPALPFELEIAAFLPNCTPLAKGPMFSVDVPVVDGVFLRADALQREAERNAAGAYAAIVERGSGARRDAILWGLDRAPFVCEIDGRRWSFDLRHERYPLPFELRLDRFTKIDHPRSSMPRSFSSDVTVMAGGTQRAVEISMNEPLRANGLVLYQASWGPANAGPGEPLFSTFAVVRNPADQWPLIGCIVMAVGLLLHFGRKLARWVRREQHGVARAALGAAKAAGLAGLLAATAHAQPAPGLAPPASGPSEESAAFGVWPDALVEHFARLPLQDGGRVKPLSTYARYALLRITGKSTLEGPDGERRPATAWLLDVLFRPAAACSAPLFLVQDSAVVRAIGIDPGAHKKRDRYTFVELEPGLPRLFQLAHDYSVIPDAERDTLQSQVIALARNVDEFAALVAHADFARRTLDVPPGVGLEAVFGDRAQVSFAAFVGALPNVATFFAHASDDGREAVYTLFDSAGRLAATTRALALFPPDPASEPADDHAGHAHGDHDHDHGTELAPAAWSTPADLLSAAYEGHFASAAHIRALAAFCDLAAGVAAEDPAAQVAAAAALEAALVPLAERRGEYASVALEVRYYELGLIRKSLAAFLAAFLVLAASWLRPDGRLGRIAYRGGGALVALGCALLCAAIAWRCVIRGRPPVSTLYETVLFVTATGVITALAVEFLHRRRVALAAAGFLGTVGLFVANGYELLDKQDTMPSLIAVLDTNFWLATHVTTITIGYAAGMLAALFGSVYVLARTAFALRPAPERALARRAFARDLARMVYGVLAFGLIFSVIGTILGGIWANDSWGRFWGWDPKENGALLICLTQTAILHARLGGFLKEYGICVAAAFGGSVVAFSWWGVNLLGVGLHSYGFTSGIQRALWTYYGLQWAVCALGVATWFALRRSALRRGARANATT